jgi:predicted naringenin-chalcone synthase
MRKAPRLLGIGTAAPGHVLTQDDAALHALSVASAASPSGSQPAGDEKSDRAIEALYRRAGVRARGSVIPAAGHTLGSLFPESAAHGPTTAERGAIYRDHAGALAGQAAARAINDSGVAAGDITHVVTASCTGFDAPGADQHLIRSLGLPCTTRRSHIGFMGCHAAINALAVASAFANESHDNRVLVVCVELCSLHFSYSRDTEKRVANALFADGAAAAIVGVDDDAHSRGCPEIVGFGSTIIPASEDLMGWRIGDHGYEMTLSPRVPSVLAEAVPAWVDQVLAGASLTRDDIASWAIHPGGPRLLTSLTSAFGLGANAGDISRAVLAEHGNMSSATVLFIIERTLRARDASSGTPRLPMLAAAFGPGLAGECMLLS